MQQLNGNVEGLTVSQQQYDSFASNYAKAAAGNGVNDYCNYPSLYAAAGDFVGKKVLDLATGNGKVARAVVELGAAEVIAVDESQKMIDIARAQTPSSSPIRYYTETVGKLGHMDKFDVVIAGWLLHYAKSEVSLRAMCHDIMLNLKPGGVFAAINPNPMNPFGGTRTLGTMVSPRRVPCDNGGEMIITLYGETTQTFSAYHWEMETYKKAFRLSGLDLEVIQPQPTALGLQRLGPLFWDEARRHRITSIFRARRRS